MTGFLIINHFLQSDKFQNLHNHLIKSARLQGINLIIKTNVEMIFEEYVPDFVLFWDKDTNLAEKLENKGYKVFNSSRAIELCDNKAKTYLTLENIVPQPLTFIAPLSYFDYDYEEFIQQSANILGYPLVYKECFGSFGEQVYLCNDMQEVQSHINGKPFLLQKFVDTSYGKDVRIEIVGGQYVAAMKRHNDNDFRANITNGGISETYVPTKNQIDISVKAVKALGLDFGGVDLLEGDIVCEVNSNAHIMNLMLATDIDIAPFIFNHIKNNL